MSINTLNGQQIAGEYISRSNPSGNDFEIGNFTTDGNWYDLDLSSLVPAGAVAVHLYVGLTDDNTAWNLKFRKNGETGQNVAAPQCHIANVDQKQECIVALDSGRIIEYRAPAIVITAINIIVRGWWL